MLPNGDYAVAVPQIFDLFGGGAGFGGTKKRASRDLKRLLGQDFRGPKQSTELGNQKINVVTLEQFNQIVLELVVKGNQQAISFMRLLQGLSLQQLFSDALRAAHTLREWPKV